MSVKSIARAQNSGNLDSDMDSRLENWARWCRSNPTRAHCMSLEHRWQPPQCWEAEQPRCDVDILDAVVIEKAVIMLPMKYKQAMKYGIVMPWVPYWEQIRKIGCKGRDYEETILKARIMVCNIIIRKC